MSIGATLRSEISLRKADPTKEPEILEWLNGFDRRSLGYPLSELVAAHVNGKTHAAIPVQQVALIEAVATNPASTRQEKAESVVLALKGIELVAGRVGIRELVFLTSDGGTGKAVQALGFEEMTETRIFKRRLGDVNHEE